MEIKILGPGCSKCNKTEKIVKEVIAETFDFFHCYDDLKGGFLPTATGGAAAAEDIFC